MAAMKAAGSSRPVFTCWGHGEANSGLAASANRCKPAAAGLHQRPVADLVVLGVFDREA